MAQNNEHREAITFKLAEQEYCIDVKQIREIRGWTPATTMPRTPEYVLGVINLRGMVLPILDLGARLGFPRQEPSPRHAIIVVELATSLCGLLVERVSDIIHFDPNLVQATPAVANDESCALVEGIITLEDRMISLLRLASVVPDVQIAA